MTKIIKWENSGWLPIVVASLMFIGVITSYVWAVVREDVEAFLPFISDAGGSPPQSGIFAIFLFLSSLVGMVTVIIRYYSIKELCQGHKCVYFLNLFSLLFGIVCICGIIVVASYPVNSKPKTTQHNWKKDVMIPHTIGAFMIFIIGVVYALTQTISSFLLRKSYPDTSKPIVLVSVRAFFVLTAFVALIVMITAIDLGHLPSTIPPGNTTDTTLTPSSTVSSKVIGLQDSTQDPFDPWESDSSKLPSIVAEWVLAFSLFAFFATMFVDMRAIGVEIRIARVSESSLLGINAGSNFAGSSSIAT